MDRLTKPSEGYFLAKREMQEILSNQIIQLENRLFIGHIHIDELKIEIDALKRVRNYVRNVMLWDIEKGD